LPLRPIVGVGVGAALAATAFHDRRGGELTFSSYDAAGVRAVYGR
jgi:hypothetical protein